MPFLKKRPWIAMALVVACICMWGCEYLGEEPKLVESGSTKDGSFVMVSDTTALLAVHYYERYEWSSGADRENCTKMGMRLVDTRGTEYNYWEGLIDSCSGLKIEPLSDSTVLFLGRNGNEWFEYYVWKIKENPVLKKAKWVNGRLPISLNAAFMRTWKNGKFLFNYYGKFALLDTAANTITQISKEDAGWPDGVEDAQYFGDDLMTLNFISENHCEFGIMRYQTDTVAVHREDSCGYVHTRLQLNGWFVNRENFDQSNKSDCIFSTDSNWQISEKPVAKYYVQYFKSLDRE
ncbi:hypothetical protein [uncultured Fibrobacter sp.]|uniref:hypothetical protein n=1 Tax=uncultured Fibrobacter sp. TaxID=261512 RepID=UPI0025FC34C6|nr:hypothetical protein [uncultured Fibrobacter sp.]